MTTATKACTKCGQTKPLAEFYPRHGSDPDGPRRSQCKACMDAATKRRRGRGLSIQNQIVRHAADPSFPLSPEAEASIYTDKPLDPELVANWKKRQQAKVKAERRRLSRFAKDRGFAPKNRAAFMAGAL